MKESVKKEVKEIIKKYNLNCSIEEFKNEVRWNSISRYQTLSKDFIREFKNNVNWHCISSYQTLSEDFIKEFKNEVNWHYISKYQTLSEEFIREFKNEVRWHGISAHQILSEDFIREFKNEVNWDYISKYQILSEDFIREFKNEVEWYDISAYQTLFEDFIREFKNEIEWYDISAYQVLSEDFIKEFDLTMPENCWLYKSKEFKLNAIKETGLYEIENDEYIIAYKSVKHNGESVYKRGYVYETGKTYTSNCDCNVDVENSFGLSAWTKEKALEYYSKGKLLKVKIPIDKLGAIVHKGLKLRCFELTVLEECQQET